MKIDPQVVAVRAAQGGSTVEREMLDGDFWGPPAPTTSPGVNATKQLRLANGWIVFHKPFDGVRVDVAVAYGQSDETPPLHEAVAWRLAFALGSPWSELVAPCVLREHDGRDGSLSRQVPGWPGDPAPTENPTWCLPAAFWDSLIAQQDRHSGNWRWDGQRLSLIDHGYTFALPGDILNHTKLVEARHDGGAAPLAAEEHQALDRLLAGADLLGIADLLTDERAQALRDRAERMRARNKILSPGEF